MHEDARRGKNMYRYLVLFLSSIFLFGCKDTLPKNNDNLITTEFEVLENGLGYVAVVRTRAKMKVSDINLDFYADRRWSVVDFECYPHMGGTFESTFKILQIGGFSVGFSFSSEQIELPLKE